MVPPVTVSEDPFQVDRLIWIQRGPFVNLLFQNTVPAGVPKWASEIFSDAFKEINAERQARRS